MTLLSMATGREKNIKEKGAD